MSDNWWYVDENERRGPVNKNTIEELFSAGTLNETSFIWTKGMDNWKKINEVPEFESLFIKKEQPPLSIEEAQSTPPTLDFDIFAIEQGQRVFYIKTGLDRNNNNGTEYGPFSLEQLKRLFEENRINEKTYIFANGMSNWTLLADFERLSDISMGMITPVEETERRVHIRKPFVANMFFHNQTELFVGVCRDVSVGGMQVLVSDFPAQVNDEVTLNVHPDNDDYKFVATGKVVRILDGNSGFSLRFIDIKQDAQKAINNYIENN